MTDDFIVGVVRGGSLAHVVASPVFIVFGLLTDSVLAVALGAVLGVVGGYIHWASRDWEIHG